LRVVLGSPAARPRCQLPRRVSRTASDDDAQREVQRTSRADQRPRELKIRSRVDEQPGVLVAEPQLAELLEPPAHDALILEGWLVGLGWVFRRRHTCCNERSPPEFVGRT